MSNTPHTLGEEFPGQMEAIHALKVANPQFAEVLAKYDDVNDRIHRAESRLDALAEEAEQALRKERLALKDAIAAALANA